MEWPGRREGVGQEEREESLFPGRKAGLGAGLEIREKEDGKIGAGWQGAWRTAGKS